MGGDRRIGVAMDFSSFSKEALRWAADNLVRHGDHLILINVQKELVYEGGEMQLWEATGSPLIPLSDISDPAIAKKYGVKTDIEILDTLNTLARQKEVVIVMKIYWGDAREKICEAIDTIPLSCLVIGNRGLSKLKRSLYGMSDIILFTDFHDHNIQEHCNQDLERCIRFLIPSSTRIHPGRLINSDGRLRGFSWAV